MKHGSTDSVCLRTAAAEFLGEHRPKLQYLSLHRLVGDIHIALSEQIFDVAIAEREAHIKPNSVRDHRGRKLMAGKRDRHAPAPLTRPSAVRRTLPFGDVMILQIDYLDASLALIA